MTLTKEQKLTEFFATHPQATLLVPEDVYDEVAATGVRCCKSDLVPDDKMVAVDTTAIERIIFGPPEMKVQKPTWWEKAWDTAGSVTSGCGRGSVEA